MARLDGKLTHQFLTTVLPDFVVEKFAAAIGVVERDRKVDIVLLIWTLILGFPAGSKRTLASLRRRFQQMLGETIARSSFHDRLTPKLAVLMRRLVDWCLDRQSQRVCPELSEQFDGFKELLAIDSTVFRLHKLLAKRWPSTNPEQAAAKLHVVSNVVEGTAESVRLSDHKTHDQGPWKTIGSWVTDCLLLLDLGYYNFHLFWRINQQGGFFLSRTKSNANPRIVASHQTVPGNSIDLVGKKLQKVLGRLKRRVIDVDVEVSVELRKYRGRQREATMTMRMVGIRNDETGEYHLYFTNVAPEVLSADDIAQSYRLRWQIELLFTRLKTTLRLHELPSSKDYIVEALIYASIAALLLSGALLRVMRGVKPQRIFPAQRMDAVFRDFATLILFVIASERRDRPIDLFELMMAEAADPNRDRSRSHDVLDVLPLADQDATLIFQEAAA